MPRTQIRRFILTLFLLLACTLTLSAQDGEQVPQVPEAATEEEATAPAPVGVAVEVAANDGKTLRGEYFVPEGAGDAPAVLLLHELYTTRASWGAVIQQLLANGFRVLAVDLRGWGATRGSINWTKAPNDTLVWLTWLRGQAGVRGDAIFTMGSSMGANLALRGCAETETCAGSVAISPGRSYFGVRTASAIESGIPVMIAYADRDYRPARDVPNMLELVGAAVETTVYEGRDHGMLLLDAHPELAPSLIAWMAARVP